MYELPTDVTVSGTKYDIRSDYRAILDICTALNDPELGEQDKGEVSLDVFYPSLNNMPQEYYQEAIEKCFWFIGGGAAQKPAGKQPQLVSWDQDFQYIVAPVNRVLGEEIRSAKYLHWWTFLSAYMEIGECLFAQIVRVREKRATGKPLDKSDREWYRKNQHLVDLKNNYTEEENETVKQWAGG